ncbi:MAG: transposase [Desulfobulbaceae bacterium]
MFFKYNRKLLGKLCHCAQQSLLSYFRVVLRKPLGIAGSIVAIQTFLEESGQVIYRSKMTHGKNRKNFEVFSVLDFIAAITQHIPDQSFQLVRYYGVSFLAYLAGTPTGCAVTGRSANRRRGGRKQNRQLVLKSTSS